MRSTFSILPYINRQKVKADGTTAIMCRITIDGKKSVIATGLYCNPTDWDGQKVKDARTDLSLRSFVRKVENAYSVMLRTKGVASADLLKVELTRPNNDGDTILSIGEKVVEQQRKCAEERGRRYIYTEALRKHNLLRDYIQSKGLDDIPLQKIDINFGNEYKQYMLLVKKYSPNKTNVCLCWLSRLLYIAVGDGKLRYNPLAEIEYLKEQRKGCRYVSQETVKKLLETKFEDEGVELSRRIFIFSIFTGLAFTDINTLRPSHFCKDNAGRPYLRKLRDKTKVEAFVPLHPIAEKVLSFYNITDDSKTVFPQISKSTHGFRLKVISLKLGLEEHLTHHEARHTFGTLLLSAGVPIESASKMMGHTNIMSTQIYAKVTDDKISRDMDSLMERFNDEEGGDGLWKKGA